MGATGVTSVPICIRDKSFYQNCKSEVHGSVREDRDTLFVNTTAPSTEPQVSLYKALGACYIDGWVDAGRLGVNKKYLIKHSSIENHSLSRQKWIRTCSSSTN